MASYMDQFGFKSIGIAMEEKCRTSANFGIGMANLFLAYRFSSSVSQLQFSKSKSRKIDPIEQNIYM